MTTNPKKQNHLQLESNLREQSEMWPEMSKSSTETRAASSEREREKAREKNELWLQYLRLSHCPKGTPKNKTKNKKLRQYLLLLLCSATISASANSAFVVLKILILSTYIHRNQTWFVVWKLDFK
jgi:hypothetical protein